MADIVINNAPLRGKRTIGDKRFYILVPGTAPDRNCRSHRIRQRA